jgi:hypothetical protein
MGRLRRLGNLVLALALLVTIVGCATTGECGYRECPAEMAIRVSVEQRFEGFPELRPPNSLYVQVHGHRVILSGQVNSEYERRLAESVAAAVAGVTGIVNFIGLTNSSR